MSTTKLYQLGLAMVILFVVAFIGERYRNVAGIVTSMPLQIPLAMWIVYTSTGGNTEQTAEFARAAFYGIIPTAVFCAVCWFVLAKSWPFPRVVLMAYGIWFVSVLISYQLIPK